MFINWLSNIQAGVSERSKVPRWGSEGLWRPCIPAAGASPRLRSAWPPSCWVLFPWQPRYSPSPAQKHTQVHAHADKNIQNDNVFRFTVEYVQMHPVIMNHWMILNVLFSWLSSSCHCFIHFQARTLRSAHTGPSQPCHFTAHKNAPSEVFVFQWSQNIKSVYAECKQRNFQENIRRRYVMQTDNYTVQITLWEPKPVNSQASVHLLKVVWHAH